MTGISPGGTCAWEQSHKLLAVCERDAIFLCHMLTAAWPNPRSTRALGASFHAMS